MRFFDPVSGCIELDGRDIRAVDTRDLRRAISLVDQDTQLLDRTVLENIALGCDADSLSSPALLGRATAAAERANALEFIQQLPGGFEHMVGERGTRLSGGQKQRVAIARAILRDSPVMILDEATSSLDAESEAAVTAALENLMVNRTTLIIAHRLATAKRADCILVMNQGCIVERGRHEELLRNKDSLYASLVHHQSLKAAEADAHGGRR